MVNGRCRQSEWKRRYGTPSRSARRPGHNHEEIVETAARNADSGQEGYVTPFLTDEEAKLRSLMTLTVLLPSSFDGQVITFLDQSGDQITEDVVKAAAGKGKLNESISLFDRRGDQGRRGGGGGGGRDARYADEDCKIKSGADQHSTLIKHGQPSVDVPGSDRVDERPKET